MREYTSTNPVFNESIRIIEITDPAHADNVNMAPEQLLQNTLCNRNNIDELKSAGTAEGYIIEKLYHVGDYCSYGGMMYRCIEETSGEWDPSCWQHTSTLGEIESLRNEMDYKNAVISSFEEMLETGNVTTNLITKDGKRFVSTYGDTYKALKKIMFR